MKKQGNLDAEGPEGHMANTQRRLYVKVGASEARRRLKGHGLGVKRIESAGNHRALVMHTATGPHLRRLEALFKDVLEARADEGPSGWPAGTS